MNFYNYCKQFENKFVEISTKKGNFIGYTIKVKPYSIILKLDKDFFISVEIKSIIFIREIRNLSKIHKNLSKKIKEVEN